MVVQQLQNCDEMWGYSGIFLNGMSGVENIKDDIDLCDLLDLSILVLEYKRKEEDVMMINSN